MQAVCRKRDRKRVSMMATLVPNGRHHGLILEEAIPCEAPKPPVAHRRRLAPHLNLVSAGRNFQFSAAIPERYTFVNYRVQLLCFRRGTVGRRVAAGAYTGRDIGACWWLRLRFSI